MLSNGAEVADAMASAESSCLVARSAASAGCYVAVHSIGQLLHPKASLVAKGTCLPTEGEQHEAATEALAHNSPNKKTKTTKEEVEERKEKEEGPCVHVSVRAKGRKGCLKRSEIRKKNITSREQKVKKNFIYALPELSGFAVRLIAEHFLLSTF